MERGVDQPRQESRPFTSVKRGGGRRRLREERGDAERALALDHKPRDLSSHNGSSNGHSPVLNLSKTAGSGSVGEQSGSEAGASHRSQDDEEEDDNLSEDLEDDNEKDEDLSDVPENLPLPAPGSESPPQALNYSQIASAAVAVSQSAQDPSVSSTETLLRNIQGLLKVAADNARQQERQINYEKGQWQGFLKTLEGALHNFIIFQLSQNHIKRH
ncbi:Dachshund like protein 1 [Trachymyrmex cornetzi]|uniref:Dachshund like protein 1 n=1 Tax=Trachymyrmex cornetzi TaxID=471704 RepID=A0A195E7J5_9HYME|nr:Dachshund like protein 1 [Trachymyrmex cornetzi]